MPIRREPHHPVPRLRRPPPRLQPRQPPRRPCWRRSRRRTPATALHHGWALPIPPCFAGPASSAGPWRPSTAGTRRGRPVCSMWRPRWRRSPGPAATECPGNPACSLAASLGLSCSWCLMPAPRWPCGSGCGASCRGCWPGRCAGAICVAGSCSAIRTAGCCWPIYGAGPVHRGGCGNVPAARWCWW